VDGDDNKTDFEALERACEADRRSGRYSELARNARARGRYDEDASYTSRSNEAFREANDKMIVADPELRAENKALEDAQRAMYDGPGDHSLEERVWVAIKKVFLREKAEETVRKRCNPPVA
jgi:hypothetical protein